MNQKGITEDILESVQIDRIGFVSASVKRTYLHSELNDSIPGPNKTSIYGAVHTRTTIESESGITTVRWLYEGVSENVDQAVYLYEFQGSMESVPIQAHPSYRSWLYVYGTEDTNGNWRPFRSMPGTGTSGMGGGSKTTKNPLLGVEAFLSIGGVWSRRYAIKEVPTTALSGVGTITATVPGNPPQIPLNRNWLKGAPVVTWRGNAWDVTEQYLLSGIGGWASIVYDGQTAYL